MKICELPDGTLTIKNITNFDPGQIFDCGQSFRWVKSQNEYTGTAHDKDLILYQSGSDIIIKNSSAKDFENIWADYFDLKTDYNKIINNLSGIHPTLDKACKMYSGIRILKQEPWEALCSFIISQNNNIPRIKKIIETLCRLFGKKTNHGFSFPDASIIASLNLKKLEPLKAGFRAKYILDAAKKVSFGEIKLDEIAKMPLNNARSELMKIVGVGSKVADCALLYGMHRLEAFPEDVWIKKVMHTLFPGQSSNIFAPYQGIAQQYLYHYSRMHPDEF